MSSSPASKPRATNACGMCRRRKVKCSGDQPCRSCVRHNKQCDFSAPVRGRYSAAHIQGLLDTIRSYEERLGETTSGQSPPKGDVDLSSQAATMGGSPSERAPGSSAPARWPSGPAFERRARSLLEQSRSQHTPGASVSLVDSPDETLVSAGGEMASETAQQPMETWLKSVPQPAQIPSKEESDRLLLLFLKYLGVNQHFVDARSFADTMTSLFDSPPPRRRVQDTMWFIEYLLVMAIGRLMDLEDQAPESLHGLDLFAKAVELMPPIHKLSGFGVISVEILSLTALYLQWRDRKHDAYFYVGIALRLAVALGCALPSAQQQCLPSEVAHRVRVWWTVFMLDRRLSAGLGIPVVADDRQSSELPADTPGFPSPQALIINIRIARITGNIMTSLYGGSMVSQAEFLARIQMCLSSLDEIGRSFPPEYSFNTDQEPLRVSRTSGSLYLMLFQAIILCTRPILLQRVKDKVVAHVEGRNPEPVTPAMDRLSAACKDSALKSIRILHALKERKEIARFGYFDLDAVFSSALTIVLTSYIDAVDPSNAPLELERADDVLKFLSRAGNHAAEQRHKDLHQFYGHVWSTPPVANDPGSPPSGPRTRRTSRHVRHHGHDAGGQQPEVHGDGDGRQSQDGLDDPGTGLFDFGDLGTDLDMEANDIYFSFNDPNLPLTGIEALDWAEVEKVFTSNGS